MDAKTRTSIARSLLKAAEALGASRKVKANGDLRDGVFEARLAAKKLLDMVAVLDQEMQKVPAGAARADVPPRVKKARKLAGDLADILTSLSHSFE